ncbi:MAG: S46 family peptidase [Ignavibacteria bacterium]|nr:S46 family peptidase [Ignavibacteria bacterium]
MFKRSLALLFTLAFLFQSLNAQYSFNPDTVKAGKYDTGKMWTFEFPPYQYLKEKYGFEAAKEWFDDVRLSALRIPGCTASFVSEDGLVMTNNHCARGVQRQVQKEGEDLAKTGFIAATLEEERKIPNYVAEQLVFLQDVTEQITSEINKGKDLKEKISIREKMMKETKAKYEKETGLKCDVTTYYNGSLFFVQGFKVFKDVRLVFQPEEGIGYFGGDPDNFTFPRYNLDCTFYRVYDENGKPVKSKNFFKWSENGAVEGELVFTVGNPGSTNRLRTVAQLEYLRDIQYRNSSFLMNTLYFKLDELKKTNPSKAEEYENLRLAFSNGWKSITQTYKALCDPYLIARKKDFEKKALEFVNSDPSLKATYGDVWKSIATTRAEMKEIDTKLAAFSVNNTYSARHWVIAYELVRYAREMQLPEEKRDTNLQSKRYKDMISNIFPKNFDPVLEAAKLVINLDYMDLNLGKSNDLVAKIFNGKNSEEAAKALLAKTLFKDKETVKSFFAMKPEEILALDDPFIKHFADNYDLIKQLRERQKEVNDTENITFGLVGQILYKMYGTSISPDANRTLRISDGLMEGYNYNGTVAPVKTTFFGLYDRFFSFNKQYPFSLPERWSEIPKDLDLSTPFNFVSTNDIVGGNSGSAIINKNAEVIGLAFDGNIESLVGNFIYLPEENRTVGVDSKGMYEAIRKVYKANKLADELKNGKLD